MEARTELVPVWLDGQRTHSKWLHSTFSELDDNAKMMLDLIEADGDTFAQRADMNYRNRPELIQMVQALHKSYQALAYKYDHLAEKYDHLKSESSVKASNNGSASNSSTSIEKQSPFLQDTTERNTKPSPSLKAIHCDDKTIDYYLASGSESNSSSFEFLSPLNLPSTNSGIDESTDEKDVVDINDLRDQEESRMRARQDERWRISKRLDDNLTKHAESIRKNDEKREMRIGLKNENKLLKSCPTGNVSGDKAKGSNSDTKRKFKRFFCLQKAKLENRVNFINNSLLFQDLQ